MIETRLMQYFLAVAKEQNITKAAKVLHITQPTLSRQMAMLEKEIGATLFIKGSRPLSLTNEGYLLRRRAEEVLDLLAKTEAEVSCGKEELEGTVTIGCGEIAAVQYLAKIIEKFHEIHPLVVFDIYTANADQIRQRMDEGLSDIGLLLEPSDIVRIYPHACDGKMGSNCSIMCSAGEKKLCHSRRTCKSPGHYAKPKKSARRGCKLVRQTL